MNVPEPMTPADEAWTAVHEIYLSLRRAGFTLHEAAAVIAAVVKTGQEGQ